MKREDGYLVLKQADIEKYISTRLQLELENIAAAIDIRRLQEGRATLQCVVVESDWPEYEPTWAAIEARVDGHEPEASNRHDCADGMWWQLTKQPGPAFLIEVGRRDTVVESETFIRREGAYRQKNRWLTKHKMFCP